MEIERASRPGPGILSEAISGRSQFVADCPTPTSAFHGGKRDPNYTHHEKTVFVGGDTQYPTQKLSWCATSQVITTGIMAMNETNVEVTVAICFQLELQLILSI